MVRMIVRSLDPPAPALLVGLGNAEVHEQALVNWGEVLDVKADQLGAPHPAGKAEQQQGPVVTTATPGERRDRAI